jgi:acyl carrier protein
VIGGEALPASAVAALVRHSPRVRVFNEYGPAETVVGCCVEEARIESETRSGAQVPIGGPIPGASLYVLDERLRLVPAGVPGELYIGGLGVARGYLARPALTAQRFVPDPFSPQPGRRLYRTGDRVRHLRDGRLMFLGRLDQQVKIRGHRIEVGEVAHVLRQHPAVLDAVVLAREAASGDRAIVAFCTRRPDGDLQDWRTFLGARLPDYMIPSALHLVSDMPLAAHGKVDREALLAFDRTARESARPRQAPRNAIEDRLAAIWCELLEHREIGVDDDFFELGGHSLFAIQMLSRVRTALDVELPLRAVFEVPTVAGLASLIAAAREDRGPRADADAPIPRVPRGTHAAAATGLSHTEIDTLLAAARPAGEATHE